MAKMTVRTSPRSKTLPIGGGDHTITLVLLTCLSITVTACARGWADENAGSTTDGGAAAPAVNAEVAPAKPAPKTLPDAGPIGDLDEQAVPVAPPPFSDEEIFPCSECHEPDDINYRRRELTMEHSQIKLNHGNRERWCFDCHNPIDRDTLRLASESLVSFKQSQRLCGQCHGPKLRDWRAGVHGKRNGFWNGEKSYLLCVHCHDPHSPRFKPIEPKPRPRRPAEIK